jgi:hypothetical protein
MSSSWCKRYCLDAHAIRSSLKKNADEAAFIMQVAPKCIQALEPGHMPIVENNVTAFLERFQEAAGLVGNYEHGAFVASTENENQFGKFNPAYYVLRDFLNALPNAMRCTGLCLFWELCRRIEVRNDVIQLWDFALRDLKHARSNSRVLAACYPNTIHMLNIIRLDVYAKLCQWLDVNFLDITSGNAAQQGAVSAEPAD